MDVGCGAHLEAVPQRPCDVDALEPRHLIECRRHEHDNELGTPLALVDSNCDELGRCGIETRVRFRDASSLNRGLLGYLRVLEFQSDGPPVLVVERLTRLRAHWRHSVPPRETPGP